jgi:PDZ domain-containing protein
MRRPRSLARTSFYTASLGVLVWAGAAVPLPYLEQVPGRPTAIPPLVEIEGTETTELNGDTSLLTIFQEQRSILGSIPVLLDVGRELRPVAEVFPPEVDRSQRLLAERERFSQQFDLAAAVGARAAGVEVELVTEVVVLEILPGSPADGLLAPGDAVLEVDGAPLGSAEELQAITRASQVGDELTLTVLHAGSTREVTVELADVTGDGQARLGIGIDTAVDELVLPFDVRLREGTRIGGPSAGMMVAVTVYDLLSDEDLLRGRTVMGTGTIDAGGRIGIVGGVPQKTVAAAEAGADLVLVPAQQLDEARDGAPEGLTIVGVRTLDEALEALRRDPV